MFSFLYRGLKNGLLPGEGLARPEHLICISSSALVFTRPYFGHLFLSLFLFPLCAFLCLLNLKFCIMRNIVNYSKHLYFSPILFFHKKVLAVSEQESNESSEHRDEVQEAISWYTIGSLVFMLKVDVVIEVNCFLSLYCSFQI